MERSIDPQSPRPTPSDPARQDAEARFRAEVERHLPRNFATHLVHGLLGQTGFRIIQAPTFLPAYVFHLTGSNSMVGLARACQAFGMFLTPVIGATLIEHRRKVMSMVFATGALMRLQVLGLALAGFYLGTQANLVAICTFLGLFGFFTGMQSVTFSFLVSKVIPVERRGRLVGLRNSLAGFTASGVGVIGGYLIGENVLGNGYASVFLVSFALTATGLMSLIFMREPESPEVKAQQKLGSRLRELPALLRSDRDYRNYMLARALGASGRMAVPYYVLYAGTRIELGGAEMGWLTGAFLVSQTGSNLLWGLIADRQGFRNVLAFSLATWVGSTLLLMYSSTFAEVAAGFIGLGAGLGGFQMGCVNLVLEFGEREDLPMRIALAQSGEQFVSILAPLLGGALVEATSYRHLFWVAAGVQLIALLVTLARVREPRNRERALVR
ncbi:MAG: MFS transporter [Myxococcales bacterium]|nr:MFS transporter [Myxococcales bacterium]